jgi:tetrahydromethanopterin S-methyltransferase subunit E
MNLKKFKKSVSVALGLLVAFFAHKWFEQAFEQPTDYGKWIRIIASLIILIIIIYFNTDEKGNF